MAEQPRVTTGTALLAEGGRRRRQRPLPVPRSATCPATCGPITGTWPWTDLVAAGPERLAAVAVEQAAFAAQRPQGRAAGPGPARRRGGVRRRPGTSIDIVTDDMPFLVDSIRMELAGTR